MSDFIGTQAQDFRRSPNRDRIIRRNAFPNWPVVELNRTVWGGFEYCYAYGVVNTTEPGTRRFRRARMTVTITSGGSNGAKRIDEVDWGDGTAEPTWQNVTVEAGYAAIFGQAFDTFSLVNDPRTTATTIYGGRPGGFPTREHKLELLDEDEGFWDRFADEAYAALAGLPFISNAEMLQNNYWDYSLWSWGVTQATEVQAQGSVSRLESAKATVALEQTGTSIGTTPRFGSLTDIIKPPVGGAAAFWALDYPSLSRPGGGIIGEAGPFPAVRWKIQISKVLVKTSQANAVDYWMSNNLVTPTEIACEVGREIPGGILPPPGKAMLLVPGRNYRSVCYPPYAKIDTGLVNLTPTCFTPPA